MNQLRTTLLTLALAGLSVTSAWAAPAGTDPEQARQAFSQYNRLHTVIAAHQGEIFFEETWGGPGPFEPVNIKSVSKTILSALVGKAIEEGVIESVDQPVVDLLSNRVPANADPQVDDITVGNLLSMQAGLQRTSGNNYARWVISDNWVSYVLSREFVADPGDERLYSTGSSHLLSAALTDASGQTTWQLAQQWLSEPLNVRIPQWLRDPQGIYFGGNDMLMSPRALLRFGEMYRQGGSIGGRQVLDPHWVDLSWQPRGTSRWSGDLYGYGWFITELGGHRAYYGRGYGGQVLWVIPELELTIVVTSSPNPPSPGGRYVRELAQIVEDFLLPDPATPQASASGQQDEG
ncbi:MAG: beta-lactamase family protein [Natronospirillum sp.]|uniref:serine hydrolase domain-containing protein n=1 Tax=Natronospirillum sp. TaxID=2812955 RepID=UPI0025E48580|nr:serine hydrolase [Natronospirillum sp.]MCH8551056.1 beta-lactamase family protein [Natronospirillum sp.]